MACWCQDRKIPFACQAIKKVRRLEDGRHQGPSRSVKRGGSIMITQDFVDRELKQIKDAPSLRDNEYDFIFGGGEDTDDVFLIASESWPNENDLVLVNIKGKMRIEKFSASMRYMVKSLSIDPETGKPEVIETYTDNVIGVVVASKIDGLWTKER
jgi:hypothetical protein